MGDDVQRVYVVQLCDAAGCSMQAIFSSEDRADGYRQARWAELVALCGGPPLTLTYEIEAWIVDEPKEA